MSFNLANLKNKLFIKSFSYFFLDFLYFFSTHKGNSRNSINSFLGLYNLRFKLFKLPKFIYQSRNKKTILQKSRKKNNFNYDLEFYTTKINLNENLKKRLNQILDNEKGNDNAASSFSKGGIDNIYIDKKNYVAKYIDVTNIILDDIHHLFSKSEYKNLMNNCSILLGYKVFLRDLKFYICKTRGENSNSYWHSDAFYPTVKGFIYLNNISEDDSPFEYSLGSTKSPQIERYYSEWFNKKNLTTGSPRIINKKHLKIINNNKISFTGSIGTMVVANTQGFHRKGKDISGLERKMLTFGFKRLGIIERILRSFL